MLEGERRNFARRRLYPAIPADFSLRACFAYHTGCLVSIFSRDYRPKYSLLLAHCVKYKSLMQISLRVLGRLHNVLQKLHCKEMNSLLGLTIRTM